MKIPYANESRLDDNLSSKFTMDDISDEFEKTSLIFSFILFSKILSTQYFTHLE